MWQHRGFWIRRCHVRYRELPIFSRSPWVKMAQIFCSESQCTGTLSRVWIFAPRSRNLCNRTSSYVKCILPTLISFFRCTKRQYNYHSCISTLWLDSSKYNCISYKHYRLSNHISLGKSCDRNQSSHNKDHHLLHFLDFQPLKVPEIFFIFRTYNW